jgi:leucyl-tRNA synthetase
MPCRPFPPRAAVDAHTARGLGRWVPRGQTVKRDTLRDLERAVQARWDAARVFEEDAPAEDGALGGVDGKFMATFPYPYMNGRLHLGHSFTISKAEFAVGFERMRGKRCLFPFGFHCTGMPIKVRPEDVARARRRH